MRTFERLSLFVMIVLVIVLSYQGQMVLRAQAPPNELSVVHRVNVEHPGLIASDATSFTDLVCRELAKDDPRWGRKARRQNDPASRNEDALAYIFNNDDANKALVDIVAAANSPAAAPAWQVYPAPNEGNGFWIPCPGGTPPDPPPAPDLKALLQAVTDLRAEVAQLHAHLSAIEGRVDVAASESTNAAQRALDLLNRPAPACSAIDWSTVPWPDYTMRSPWGIGTFVLKPRK